MVKDKIKYTAVHIDLMGDKKKYCEITIKIRDGTYQWEEIQRGVESAMKRLYSDIRKEGGNIVQS